MLPATPQTPVGPVRCHSISVGHHAFDCASLFQNWFQKDNREQNHNCANGNAAVNGCTRYLVRRILVATAQQPGQIGGSAVSEQQAQANNNLSQGKGNRDRAHLVGPQPAYKIGVYLVVKAMGLTFFQRGRIDTGYYLRVGNGGAHLILDSEQDGGLQTVVFDRVHGAGCPGAFLVSRAGIIYILPAPGPVCQEDFLISSKLNLSEAKQSPKTSWTQKPRNAVSMGFFAVSDGFTLTIKLVFPMRIEY